MRTKPSEWVVDFPTLWVALDWIEAHCVIPDRFEAGDPFILSGWQGWASANYFRVKADAPLPDARRPAIGAAAFHYRRILVVMPQKALALNTPVATPSGWTTMGSLVPGDVVFAGDGTPTRVMTTSPTFRDGAYRVTFSDHSSLVACGDHEWLVDRRKGKGYALGERWTTSQMLDHGLVDTAGARRFRIGMHPGLDLPDADLPIPSYTLGAWLGDGGSHDARITGIDEGVYTRIELDGFSVTRDRKIPKRRQVHGLIGSLRAAGLLRNKHIPPPYQRASLKQRWALLQGLMDTDGHAMLRAGRCEFTTTSPALLDGVVELLAGLGIKSVTHAGRARLNGRDTGPKWRIAFSARQDMPVFGLERKQRRLSAATAHAQFRHRRITAIDPIDPVPTRCITVDHPSHTFLAGRQMVVTGNSGKGPWSAAMVLVEGCGPTMFAGWATGTEVYRCRDHGCHCGWEYSYRAGEPMGVPRPTPLIQLTAYSHEQVGNVYKAMQPMVERGPLADLIPAVGEVFTRLPDNGRIDTVTSSAKSRLGQRVTHVMQDEVGVWLSQNAMDDVAKTQRRGVAGMGGRIIMTTNAWDPAEMSVAQTTALAALRNPDIFVLHPQAPPQLSFRNKEERRRILRIVYADSPWVDLEGEIEPEAAELMQEDPANAERFYGNRLVEGLGAWMPEELWDGSASDLYDGGEPPDGTAVAVGFDGSETDDWTGIRCETQDGYQFTPTYGPDRRPTIWDPAEWGGAIPAGEVHAAMKEIATRFVLRRAQCDPRGWRSEIAEWNQAYRGADEDRFFEFDTYSVARMWPELDRFRVDVVCRPGQGDPRLTHDRCAITRSHVMNARKAAKGVIPDPVDGTLKQRYLLVKPDRRRKIDLAMSSVLAHAAAAELHAGAAWAQPSSVRRAVGRAWTR